MENEYAMAPLLFVLGALLVGALLKLMLKRVSFPYTVGLFCVGLVVGIVYREGLVPEKSLIARALMDTATMEPDMLLYIFLPVLIFGAAYEIDLHTFRKSFINANILAIPGLIISMGLFAAMIMGISLFVPEFSGWNWQFALMFGAMISATDPVAVVALLKELNTSKRFSTLVDAESLLNDGTGIVLFMLFFGPFIGHTALFESPIYEFLAVAAGGAVFGFVMAELTIFFITRLKGDEMVQNSVMILSAYVTFILAQGYLGLSGVIALVAYGLTVSYKGKLLLNPKANEFTEKFWDLASFIANTLIFIMVGVIIALHVKITLASLLVTAGVYIGGIIIRMIVIMLFYPVMKRNGYGLTMREAIILGWGGLRGALGLTLALMVTSAAGVPQEIRDQVMLMTAGIVTLTLTINATTTKRMLQWLGLTDVPAVRSFVDYGVKLKIKESSEYYYEKIKGREIFASADWERVKSFIPDAGTMPDISGCSKEELLNNLRLVIYGTETQLIRQLFAEGTISSKSFRKLIYSQERHFDSNGRLPLSDRTYLFNLYNDGWFVKFCTRYSITKRLFYWVLLKRVISLSDTGRGFLSIQRDSLEELSRMRKLDVDVATGAEILNTLEGEVKENITRMNGALKRLSDEWPEAYSIAITGKVARMMLCNERKTVRSLEMDGIINSKDCERLEESIAKRASLVDNVRKSSLIRKSS